MKVKINTPLIISGALVATTASAGVMLASSVVSADDSVVDEVNITVPISCTLSGSGMTSHNDEILNGTYKADIGSTTLSAFCNDNGGFAIYATGYTGDEIGGANSNKLVGTSASSNATIDTGLATTAGNPDVSNWAMKLTATGDSGDTSGANALTIDSAPNTSGGADATFSQYHVVPNEYTKVAHKNVATSMDANNGGATITTTYSAYISKTQPADTYTGKVIYTLVHPSTAPAPSTISCNPAGTTIGTNTSTDIVCMQDISSTNKSSILTSMTSEQQYTLMDKRDEKTYTIAKLADGNIWMTQNLDHDIVTDGTVVYDSTTTDLPANTTWIPERATYPTGTTTWGLYNSTTGVHEGFYRPESYDPGDLYWNGALSDWTDWNAYYNSCAQDPDTWLYSDCNESLNPLATYTTVTGTPTPQYHLGNFYNWTAALATNDSSSYGAYDSGTDSYINTETNQSICPAGWTLPIGGYYQSPSIAPDKSFQDLIENYGWNDSDWALGNNQKIWESPIYFGLSGYWYGMLGFVGFDTLSWSSVAYGGGNAYILYADSDDYVSPDYYYNYVNGYIVRCVAR